jgi:hypothetical protein
VSSPQSAPQKQHLQKARLSGKNEKKELRQPFDSPFEAKIYPPKNTTEHKQFYSYRSATIASTLVAAWQYTGAAGKGFTIEF